MNADPPIIAAAKRGSVEELRDLLPGANLNLRDPESGQTGLSCAAREGHYEVVKLLLRSKADFNVEDRDGRKSLSWAAEKGHTKIARVLLEEGDKVDAGDSKGRTPLSWAAQSGHLETVNFLVEKKSDVNLLDANKRIPLSWAAEYGHSKTVECLIRAESEVNSRDSQGRTPLMYAAMSGDIHSVQILADNGAKLNLQDTNRKWSALFWAVLKENMEMVEWLINTHCEVSTQDSEGKTPLMYAAYKGNVKIVEALINTGNAKVDLEEVHWKQRALARAITGEASQKKKTETVRILINAGSEVDARDSEGKTPLSEAASRGFYTMMQHLLTRALGSGVKSRAEAIENAFHIAWRKKYHDITGLILQNQHCLSCQDENGRSFISWAAARRKKQELENLADKDIVFDLKDLQDRTPLSWAAGEGNLHGVEFLLGKETNANSQDRNGRTPLSWAAENGKEHVTKFLLKEGVLADAQDEKARTPLSWAAEKGNGEVMKLLLQKKDVKVNCEDINGRTPFSWAAANGSEDAMSLLLGKGAKADYPDKSDRTPLSWAAGNGYLTAVRFLLEKASSVSSPTTTEFPVQGGLPEEKNDPQTGPEINGPVNESTILKNRGGGIELPTTVSDKVHSEGSGQDRLEVKFVQVNSKDTNLYTPLWYAAVNGHFQVVGLLLSHGANAEVETADRRPLINLVDAEFRVQGDDDRRSRLRQVLSLLEAVCADGPLLDNCLPEAKKVDGEFMATMVYILKEQKTDLVIKHARKPVLELLEQGDKEPGEKYACKWLHVPSNNMMWIEVLMARHYEKSGDTRQRNAVLKKEIWIGLQHSGPAGWYHARFMKPTCQVLPLQPENSDSRPLQKGFCLFMPYLHWETAEEFEKLKRAMKEKQRLENAKESSSNMQNLLWTYLDQKHPLHPRRSLNQYYYYYNSDESTDPRRTNQTGEIEQGPRSKTIMPMVDQLWMWVLPQVGQSPPTLITSFPERSNREKSDVETEIVSNIISTCHTLPVRTVNDLAEAISSQCSRIYLNPMDGRHQSLQFLENYMMSIGRIADEESRRISAFSQFIDRPSDRQASSVDSLDVKREIRLLCQIKEKREELSIISSVYQTQKEVLTRMEGVIRGQRQGQESTAESIQLDTGGQSGYTPLVTVHYNISLVENLDRHAAKTESALRHLLDLKLKQATFLLTKEIVALNDETKDQTDKIGTISTQTLEQTGKIREINEDTRKQGKTIMFFTIITIIFLPLSFLAVFFTINIVEFTRTDAGLSLAYVSKYIFSISAAISIPSIILALNVDKLETWVKFWKWCDERTGNNDEEKG